MKNNEPFGWISAGYGPLKGRRIVGEMIPTIIDELPLMAVIATRHKARLLSAMLLN
jgi:hypothetical protein